MADSLDSGSSAHYGRAGSSPASRTKKERHPHGCLSFLVQHFCYAKVVACGRVTEREWGNPSKVSPPHTPPSLRWAGVQTTKHVGSHKRKETSERMSLFFWCGDSFGAAILLRENQGRQRRPLTWHPLRGNKYPPAEPGVFLRRAKPYVTSHASCGVGTTCHLHRLSYPHRYKSGTFSFLYSRHP